MKTCYSCKETKALTEFYKARANADGYENRCKKCKLKYCGKRHKDNPQYLHNWQRKNRDKCRQYTSKWEQNNLEKRNQLKKDSYYRCKDGHYSVYLLPDHNYVGITGYVRKRMSTHKSHYNRNTDNYQILHTFKTEKEALAKEAEYHAMGYNG